MGRDIGGKGRMYMRKKTYDENMPIGRLTRVPNFLPPPEELVFPDDIVKVTINLHKSDVDFFKKRAGTLRVKYQQMLRAVIREYVLMHSKK